MQKGIRCAHRLSCASQEVLSQEGNEPIFISQLVYVWIALCCRGGGGGGRGGPLQLLAKLVMQSGLPVATLKGATYNWPCEIT